MEWMAPATARAEACTDSHLGPRGPWFLLERLGAIRRSIVHRAPLADVLQTICEGASELVGDEVVGLRLVDPEDPRHLVLVATAGIAPEILPRLLRTPITSGIGGRAVVDERLIVADDYAASPFAIEAFAADGLSAAMAAPVYEGKRVIGSLAVATYRQGRSYSRAEQEALVAFADHASLALNDARTVDALRASLHDAIHHATHDPLCDLPNRSMVFEHLDEVLVPTSNVGEVALLFIDLDRFKAVNDSLGHDAGDAVLVEVARRLRATARPTDLVARLAGDEFVIVISGSRGAVDAHALARRVAAEIAAPIATSQRDVMVTATIGIAQSNVDDVSGADELLRAADMAMYRAKRRGGDPVGVFRGDLRTEVSSRLDIEHALRKADFETDFHLQYQPVVDVDDARPFLVEALVRWDRDGVLVPPDAFIPVAEETGTIIPLGAWVLREACRQLASWRRTEPTLARLQVAVNVSARQFAAEGFVDLVAATLRAFALPPNALWLEVTESMLLEDVEQAIVTLGMLKAHGVHLAIDDFGTGYSSLAYLRRFPVDVVKIDRSFVEHLGVEPQESAVLAAIVQLAQAVGVDVIAEGIETGEQLTEVARVGVSSVQGFHIARPQRAPDVVEWIRRRVGLVSSGRAT